VEPADFAPINPRGVDFAAVREELRALVQADKVAGTEMVRIAMHSSATHVGTMSGADASKGRGGSYGGTMRFPEEYERTENYGLVDTIKLLQPIRDRHAASGLQYGDLYTLAGVVAVEELGGPKVPWRAGRKDLDKSEIPPEHRIINANLVEQVISKIIGIHRDMCLSLGFKEREMIALFGARTIGGATIKNFNRDTKSFEGWLPRNGPWTANPTVFDNSYFKNLVSTDLKYVPYNIVSPLYGKEKGMHLWIEPEDLDSDDDFRLTLVSLQSDQAYRPMGPGGKLGRKIVKEYAEDQDKWFADFSKALSRFLELGCDPETLVEV
jgi:cytochrome c peroxidase